MNKIILRVLLMSMVGVSLQHVALAEELPWEKQTRLQKAGYYAKTYGPSVIAIVATVGFFWVVYFSDSAKKISKIEHTDWQKEISEKKKILTSVTMQINSAIGKDGDIIITNNEKDEELPGKVTKYISNSDKKISELESQVEGVKRENTKLYGYLSGVHITLASNSNKTKNHNKNTLDDDYKKLPEEVKSIIAEKNNLKKENKNLKNKQSIRYLRLKLIKKQIEKLT